MDNIIKLNILIKQLSQIASTLDLAVLFEDLTEQISNLTKINNSMVSEINSKNKQLKLKDDEIANFTKVSFIQSLNKQLNEKENHIKFLEAQLNKYKKQTENITTSKITTSNKLKQRKQQEAEELEQEEAEELAREEAEELAQEEADKLAREEAEELAQEEADELAREEAEKLAREEADKLAREEAEELAREAEQEAKLNKNKNKKNKQEIIIEESVDQLADKTNKKKKKKQLVEQPIEESIEQSDEPSKLSVEVVPEKQVMNEYIFDINDFEEINGYELIQYKKKYYLRDLETNELYGILNNEPYTVVGLISSHGKVKFH